MRCWGDRESFNFMIEHLFVQILWERVRLALMMFDEKLGGALRFFLWQAVEAKVQRGAILPRRKDVQLMDDWVWKAQ